MDSKIRSKIYKTFYKFSDKTLKIGALLSLIFAIVFVILGLIIGLIFNYIGLSLINIGIITLFFLGISLIFEPFLYSYFANNISLRATDGKNIGINSFLGSRKLGKRPQFKNQLSLFRYLVISMLIFVGTFGVMTFIFGLVGLIEGSFAYNFYRSVAALDYYSTTLAEELQAIINDHYDVILEIIAHSSFVGALIALYFFIHKISKSLINYLAAPLVMSMSGRLTSFVIRRGNVGHKKEYFGMYYGTLWPFTVLYFVTFSAVFYLLYYFGPKDAPSAMLILSAILVIFIGYFAIFPIICNTNEVIWYYLSEYYLQFFIENTNREFEALKANPFYMKGITKEQIADIEAKITIMKANVKTYLENKKLVEPLADYSEKN